jgi:hypothetical protein
VFEKERILQLHNQGHCTASICVRLALPIEYVRQVVGAAKAIKALRYAKWLPPQTAARLPHSQNARKLCAYSPKPMER